MVDCGYQTTHILSVLDGQLVTGCSRRINIGGAQIDAFMQRLLQLKYPGHVNAVTLARAEVSCVFIIHQYLSHVERYQLSLVDFLIQLRP